jgi:enoyl-CoA hydratase
MVLRMALSGEPLDASTAQAASLVAEVVPQAELIPRALALAQQIATYSPEAVRAAKDVVLSAAESPDLDIASLRARAAAVTHGAAGRAGAAAFAAKTGGR